MNNCGIGTATYVGGASDGGFCCEIELDAGSDAADAMDGGAIDASTD
jgi:hypothetical protein